ncbi:tetratricopeptide repeat protein [Nocardia rhamnosiphila]
MIDQDPHELKQLSADLATLRLEVGQPSYPEMDKLLRNMQTKLGKKCWALVSQSTLKRAAKGNPAREDTVVQFVEACRLYAEAKGLPVDAARFEARIWRERWQKTRARGGSSPTERERSVRDTELRPRSDVGIPGRFQLSVEPVAKPVSEWSAEALRIHTTVGGGRMVDYVPRPVDTAVREAIDRARSGRGSRMILLRGGSCTGKTRCAIEALRDRIPRWSLVRPIDKDQLWHLLVSDIAASTVLWLDDIQALLGASDAKDQVVQKLFELLTDGRTVIVIGTVWDDTDSAKRPALGDEVQRLVDLNAEEIDVPSTFSASQIDVARKVLGAEFPEVVDAASVSGELVQNLAGGPALVQMYESARPRLSAVLTAAVDLFRIGHRRPIPEGMLRGAALYYLSSRERLLVPIDWFETAIGWATTPVKRAVAALEPARTVLDGDVLDGFVLADFLGYYGKRHRSEPPREQLWDIVAARAVDRSAAHAVAQEAQRRLLYPETERLYRRTIELGWLGGWADLARLATERRDLALADELVGAAQADLGAALGYPGYLWYEIAVLYYTVGDRETAELMLQNAGDDFIDWSVVARLREQYGDGPGADEAARRDCEREGIPITWHEYLIPVRAAAGDFAGAERAAEAMAAAGFGYGWAEIGNVLMMSSHRDYRGAVRAYRTAAELGYEYAWQDLGQALARLGEYDEAEQAILRTALADVEEPQYAWAELAALRHRRGNPQGAEAAAEQGEGMGWARLASERARDGHFDSAKAAAAKAAHLGDGTGWADLAGRYERAGLQDEAELAARNAAPFESGGIFSGANGWLQIIHQRCEAGDWEAAKRACLEYQETDAEYVQDTLVKISERSGNCEAAKQIAQRSKESPPAMEVVETRGRQDDSREAEELAIHAAAVHGQTEPWWRIAKIRQRSGDASTYHQLTHFGLCPDGTLRE